VSDGQTVHFTEDISLSATGLLYIYSLVHVVTLCTGERERERKRERADRSVCASQQPGCGNQVLSVGTVILYRRGLR
jgi:hypothetical protein